MRRKLLAVGLLLLASQPAWAVEAAVIERAVERGVAALRAMQGPDGAWVFVNSGSRTDHGEVQDNDGSFPDAREGPLTSRIFRLPADGEGITLPNDEEAVSFTIVLVDNTPKAEPTPTGDVAPATGKPRATLPATDTLDAASSAPAGDNWRIVLLAMAGLLTAGLMLTPGRSVVRRENDVR